MPQIRDGLGIAILDPVTGDKCPICERAKHETTKDKKEKKGCLDSRPQDLGCKPIPINPDLPNYTTAAHHLIPVNQCLKQFPRLSQMCDAVGYNVNNPQNGLSLPTVGQKKLNSYKAEGKKLKYGQLKEADKKKISFIVMGGLNLQWHVGHHNWDAAGIDTTTDTEIHPENYDKLVKIKLRDLEKGIKQNGSSICDPAKSAKGQEIIADINSLSGFIKGHVLSWNCYFVSALSCSFSRKYRV